MSRFVAIAWDGPEGTAIRALHRDAHFAYIATIADRIAVSGPIKDAEGVNIGSLLIYNVETAEEAQALLTADPYFHAGLWDRWTLNPFLAAAGDWVGGTIW
jgi:uncharacterized protein